MNRASDSTDLIISCYDFIIFIIKIKIIHEIKHITLGIYVTKKSFVRPNV